VDSSARRRWDQVLTRTPPAGEPGDALEIESIKVSPDPPKPGHKLTIEAKGKVNNLVDVRPLLFSCCRPRRERNAEPPLAPARRRARTPT